MRPQDVVLPPSPLQERRKARSLARWAKPGLKNTPNLRRPAWAYAERATIHAPYNSRHEGIAQSPSKSVERPV